VGGPARGVGGIERPHRYLETGAYASQLEAYLGSVRRVICASPDYLERRGVPEEPGALSGHQVVVGGGESERVDWRLREGRELCVVRVRPRLTCSTNHAAISAALAGWGLARVLSYQVGPALASGELVAVLEDYEPAPIPVHVVHPGGRRAPAKVRAFVDLAVEGLRANPQIGR